MAINPLDFYNHLYTNKIRFFSGVPDSLLKEFCLCIDDNISKGDHIITANEGNAVGLASGYFLATSSIPLVYMQNSGLGNAINPLLSLCDQEVYSVPMLLLIGWRGEPGVKDEPQHIKQGAIQTDLLSTLDIPYEIISKNASNYKEKINKLIQIAKKRSRPTALVIKKGTFEKYGKNISNFENTKMKREDVLNIILKNVNEDDIIISTTGKTSREIFEIRKHNNQTHEKDFLTVGSMGHCSSIALGIALKKPNRKVICIDGDGSMLMHLGSLTSITDLKPTNFYHILLNNEAHESVGGQSTAAKNLNIADIANTLGYNKSLNIDKKEELSSSLSNFLSETGPVFLEIKITVGSRDNLGRPDIAPEKNKIDFMEYLKH